MQNVIYINNDSLQIVKAGYDGNFDIKNHIDIRLARGSIINGTILNKEEIQKHLSINREYIKDATLLIDSTSILAKKLELANMTKKQIKEVLKYELGVQDVNDKYIYDVNVIKSKQTSSVLGCAVPQSLIETYLSLFNDIDIKIPRIDIATNAITKFVNSQKDMVDSSFVLNIVSEDNLISFLFENGKYKLSNRNRLMTNPQSEEYINEVFSKFSSMIQFSKSQKSVFRIETSYYIGLGREVLQKLKVYTQRYEPDIRVEEIILNPSETSQKNASLFYPLIATIREKQDINLVEAYKKATQIQKISRQSIFKISLLGFIVASMLVGYTYIYINTNNLNKEIESVKSYLQDPITVNKFNESKRYKAKNINLKNIITSVELSQKDMAKYKILKKRDIDNIFAIAGDRVYIRTISYDSKQRTINISGSAKNELQCSEFVTSLYKIPTFSNVTYKGYRASQYDYGLGKMQNSVLKYSFTAVVNLKDGEKIE